jgi:UTP-glucose-1-phosphate uridylyltransferase
MESNAVKHAFMETETNNNKNATMMYLAQLIAKGVGVSTLLAQPLVTLEFSLACSL